jgi:rhodanese-related sulfurtransferase
MPKSIVRDEVRELLERGAQLVEVLPPEEYEEEHLPGALNIPLRRIKAEARERLDPSRSVIVYCWDSACDLSPRAAWRLESLGFGEVYDYSAGKLDWISAGLPTKGTLAAVPRAGDLAREDTPTCALDEPLAEVRERALEAGWDACVAVNDQGVVFGLLRAKDLRKEGDMTVEEAMLPGPGTFRPNVDARKLAALMAARDLPSLPITTNEGVLVGLLLREDAERAAGRQRRKTTDDE